MCGTQRKKGAGTGTSGIMRKAWRRPQLVRLQVLSTAKGMPACFLFTRLSSPLPS